MFQKIKALFSTSGGERRAANPTLSSGIGFLLADYSNSGLSEEQMLDAVHSNPMFFACVNLMATSMASADVFITENGVRNDEHLVAQRLRRPNSFHTQYTFLWLISAYLMSTGRVYILRLKDGSLIPLSPTKVVDQGQGVHTVTFGSTTIKECRIGKNLIRITMPDLRQPYTSGTGLGAVLSQEIDISEAAAEHEHGYLHNHARPDMIVNYADMSEDQLKKVKAGWTQRFRGGTKSGNPVFTNVPKVDVQQLTSTFKDLGLMELRKYSANTIRETFGIPPELLGDVQNSNRATIDAADYLFKTNSVEPRLTHVLSELAIKLVPLMTDSKGIGISHNSVVPADRDFKFEVMKEFPQAFSINEARYLTGSRPIEDGDRALDNSGRPIVQVEDKAPTRATPAISCGRMGSLNEEIEFNTLIAELSPKKSLPPMEKTYE